MISCDFFFFFKPEVPAGGFQLQRNSLAVLLIAIDTSCSTPGVKSCGAMCLPASPATLCIQASPIFQLWFCFTECMSSC